MRLSALVTATLLFASCSAVDADKPVHSDSSRHFVFIGIDDYDADTDGDGRVDGGDDLAGACNDVVDWLSITDRYFGDPGQDVWVVSRCRTAVAADRRLAGLGLRVNWVDATSPADLRAGMDGLAARIGALPDDEHTLLVTYSGHGTNVTLDGEHRWNLITGDGSRMSLGELFEPVSAVDRGNVSLTLAIDACDVENAPPASFEADGLPPYVSLAATTRNSSVRERRLGYEYRGLFTWSLLRTLEQHELGSMQDDYDEHPLQDGFTVSNGHLNAQITQIATAFCLDDGDAAPGEDFGACGSPNMAQTPGSDFDEYRFLQVLKDEFGGPGWVTAVGDTTGGSREADPGVWGVWDSTSSTEPDPSSTPDLCFLADADGLYVPQGNLFTTLNAMDPGGTVTNKTVGWMYPEPEGCYSQRYLVDEDSWELLGSTAPQSGALAPKFRVTQVTANGTSGPWYMARGDTTTKNVKFFLPDDGAGPAEIAATDSAGVPAWLRIQFDSASTYQSAVYDGTHHFVTDTCSAGPDCPQ